MTIQPRYARTTAIALFGLLGVQGLWGAAQQFELTDTGGKLGQTAAVVTYGLTGIMIATRSLLRRRPSKGMKVMWSAGVVLATGLAPTAWGDAPLVASLMSGAAGSAIVALSLWLLAKGRSDTAETQPPS